jgi:glycosyltransferase involved in cell wall biosynthesis
MAASEKKKSKTLAGRTIVQILPALNYGGVERGTLEMAEAIIGAGGNAVVVSSGGALESKLSYLGARHVTMPVDSKNPFRILMNRRQIKALLVRLAPDLVHIRSRAPAWSALGVARRMNIPVVTTIHGRFRTVSRLKRFYNSVMVKADHIIAISRHTEGVIKAQFPGAGEKISVIHRGVDTRVFDPQAVDPERLIEVAEELAIPDGIPVVMLPARPAAWKGMAELIEAMSQLRKQNFLLLLVGAGDGKPELQAELAGKINAAGMMSKARLTSAVDDMPAALMLADVVVMPSTTPEPFGRVAVEASAMGCPVVAFDHGGAAESIADGVTGFMAKPGDIASLSKAVSTALGLGKVKRQKLALEARNHVKKHFSSNLMCQATIRAYLKLI